MAEFDVLREILTAWKPGIFEVFKPLSIAGIEVTQAIQYCRAAEHLTDKNDRAADNSLTLVADKPAVVRVYVHGGFQDVSGVRGTVTVQRRRYGIWTDTGTLTALTPSTITAFRDAPYNNERGWLSSSLNFLIPGDEMQGEMRLNVHVERPGDSKLVADASEVIYATLRQTLKLRGIPVQYWGPDPAGNQVKLAAPTQADFVAECGWTCNAWPVSPRPDVSLAGTFTWSNPLTGNMANGDCPTSWNNLLFWLAIARVLDGDRPNHFYYALLPTGIPVGDTGGCGNPDGVGAGFLGGNGGATLGHELGHVLDFDHVRGNLPPDDDEWDPSYPAYEPYDTETMRTGTIGEYGLDVTTSTVMNPNWATDFMGYGGSRWMSPYHHGLMIQKPMLNPVWVPLPRGTLPPVWEEEREWPPLPPNPPDPPWGEWTEHVRPPEREALVYAAGVRRDGVVELSHVLRLEAFNGNTGRRVGGARVELLDAEGGVLSRAPLYEVPTRACGSGRGGGCAGCGGCGCGGCGCGDGDRETLVAAKVPDPGTELTERLAAVRVVQDGEEVWRREAPSYPPNVGDVDASIDGDVLRVRWTIEAAGDAARVDRFVRWSADGREWTVVAVGLEEDAFEGTCEGLPAGPGLVQVVVTDGFHTAYSDLVQVEVPWRRPSVAIMWPRANAPIPLGTPLRLWAVATAADGEPLEGERVQWELDGERVAVGADQWVEVELAEGEHRAVVRAEDGRAENEAEVVFVVRGRDRG